jgi:hypothetical protein
MGDRQLPSRAGERHDSSRLIDEGAPGLTVVIDDVVEGLEDAVRQPILTHELPDVFLAVGLGCARRQRQERDIAWDLDFFGTVPAGFDRG